MCLAYQPANSHSIHILQLNAVCGKWKSSGNLFYINTHEFGIGALQLHGPAPHRDPALRLYNVEESRFYSARDANRAVKY